MWQHSGIALFFVVSNIEWQKGAKTNEHRKSAMVRKNPGYILSNAKKYKRGGVKIPLTASKEKLHLQTHGGLLVTAKTCCRGQTTSAYTAARRAHADKSELIPAVAPSFGVVLLKSST